MARYSRDGVEVHVVTATRGEKGALRTGDQVVTREELPAVRESELRSVLVLLGAHPPVLLGYRDGEVERVDFPELVVKVRSHMERLRPDVVITFGPAGITDHADHKTVHRATLEAFHQYRTAQGVEPRLMYFAIPRDIAEQFELELDGPEVEPTVLIDISDYLEVKIKALRMYNSQEDVQELADMVQEGRFGFEGFYQAYPSVTDGVVSTGFWD
jgi:LmbE family N-acetylglucosaminyl deacetylase